MRPSCPKLLLILTLTLTLASFSSAGSQEWRLQTVDEPFSMNSTGINTTTLQLVTIEYNKSIDEVGYEGWEWGAVTPDNLQEQYLDNLTYRYNKSSANKSRLNHLGSLNSHFDNSPYWFAELKPNKTRGDKIFYEAVGNTTDGVDASKIHNVTEDLRVGDLKLEVLTEIPDKVEAGKEFRLEVKVKNASSGEIVNGSTDSGAEGSVEVIFANQSGQADSKSITNWDNDNHYFYDYGLTAPAATNTTYMLHIDASNTSGDEPHGSYSTVIQTLPEIHGEVTEFSSPGNCESSEGVERCDPEAEIDAGYNITAASAQGVNVTTYVFNESGKHLYNRSNYDSNISMSEGTENDFEANLEVPDVNTTKYKNKVELEFKAYNQDREHIDRRNVTIDPFEIHSPAPDAETGDNYLVKFELRKQYNVNDKYDKSRFNEIKVNVTNAVGDIVENYSMSELKFNQVQDRMEKSLLIPGDAQGPYSLEIQATNIYNTTNSKEFSFGVTQVNKTFDVSDAKFDVTTLWDQNFTLDIGNRMNSKREITFDENLPDQITLNNDSVLLDGNEDSEILFTVNLTSMKDASGTLEFSDNMSTYSKNITVEADAVDCPILSGNFCSETQDWVNLTITNSSKNKLRDIDVRNVGPIGSNLQYNASLTGEITDHAEIIGETELLNMTDTQTVQINYTAISTGNFTGKVVFESDSEALEINTALEANLTDSDSGEDGSDDNEGGEEETGSISVSPSSIDLGTFPEEQQKTATIELTNELEKEISEVNVASSTFAVSTEFSDNISVGDSSELELAFESVTSSSGSVTVSAGGKSSQISVSAEPVPNYKNKAEEELKPDMEDLQSEVKSDSNLESGLNDVSDTISEIESSWDQEDYGAAKTKFNDADQELDRIQNAVNSDSPGGDDSENSGGIPIIPVAGGIFLVILIAFVFFTSYVPEEGDPLYSVLGE